MKKSTPYRKMKKTLLLLAVTGLLGGGLFWGFVLWVGTYREGDVQPAVENGRREIYVMSGSASKQADGSKAFPFHDIPAALAVVRPGTTVMVYGGSYAPFEIAGECSGTKEAPVVISAAAGERPIISGDGDIDVFLSNVEHIVLEGFEIVGGTHGIYYESTPERGGQALENITIRNCVVRDVKGTHGICVYAANDKAPVKNFVLEGCEVSGCDCGDSEAVAFNGNVDGFVICNNLVHDNNNIGIDMIGFEGTAIRRQPADGKQNYGEGRESSPYSVDYVRNGKCFGNVVYEISTYGNNAYRTGREEYDLCAGGIYVDGGQDIEIYDNFVFGCDIGIEVATERKEKEDPIFQVSGVKVHDNVIADCGGYCGLAFGGYDGERGFTKGCSFYNNTLYRNTLQIAVQRSIDNHIYHNLFVGGDVAVEYNEDCEKTDMVNDFSDNYFAEESEMQELFAQIHGFGSGYTPESEWMAVYRECCPYDR